MTPKYEPDLETHGQSWGGRGGSLLSPTQPHHCPGQGGSPRYKTQFIFQSQSNSSSETQPNFSLVHSQSCVMNSDSGSQQGGSCLFQEKIFDLHFHTHPATRT